MQAQALSVQLKEVVCSKANVLIQHGFKIYKEMHIEGDTVALFELRSLRARLLNAPCFEANSESLSPLKQGLLVDQDSVVGTHRPGVAKKEKSLDSNQ